MDLFLSWSGERSKAAARAFQDFVACLLQNVKPWMSDTDIKAGDRWGVEVQAQLEKSDFGIVFLTRENLEAPWLLFETGALAKKVRRSRLVPYLIGLKVTDIPPGPLTLFQAKIADRAETWDVIKSINDALAEKSLDQSQAKKLFDKLWPDFEGALAKIASDEEQRDVRQRSSDEVQEEILITLRDIHRRLTSVDLVSLQSPSRRTSVKEMLEAFKELLKLSTGDEAPPEVINAAAAFMRDGEEDTVVSSDEPGES